MGRIIVLPPAVQGQIAAGEVVERPASIVKELVENAIDAGARHVEVLLEEGGVAGITVRDDGCGMEADEALLAFSRHATSKLRAADDLERVATFGFRGEALPSVAAAGRVLLRSRVPDAPSGVTVEADHRGARPGPPVGMAPGTVVEVRDLFAATPARLKFLRRPATELGHAVDAVTRLAVAHPEVGITVRHEDRTALELPPVGDLGERLGQVLGRARAKPLVAVDERLGDLELRGFVGPPRDTLSSPRLVWTYVAVGHPGEAAAPRWIRDRVLLRAVLDGYDTLLMRGRYPLAVLVLWLPPGGVDVNVHPAKLEVRFRDGRPVHRIVSEGVRRTLVASLATGTSGAAAPPPLAMPAAHAAAVATTARAGASVAREAPIAADAGSGLRALREPGLWRAAPDGFGDLRYVAQLFAGYLLCDAGDRLVLIDQHAAHERVIFDRLTARRTREGVERDALLVPEAVAVSRAEAALLGEHGDLLAAAGLEGEPFGPDRYLLRTVPRLLRGRDAGEVLRAVAADLAAQGASRAAERAAERVLATVACHSATRVGQRLAPSEATALLAQMDAALVNAHCPHGRPVAVQLRRAQVEALFGR